MEDQNQDSQNPIYMLMKFFVDARQLLIRCTKPDRREFTKIAYAVAIGFCLMGFIGFFIKLIHIPIINIIVGGGKA
jgi:protein transport protein SEC61 subunit gamma-like protein